MLSLELRAEKENIPSARHIGPLLALIAYLNKLSVLLEHMAEGGKMFLRTLNRELP
jgi:hypothetical protein